MPHPVHPWSQPPPNASVRFPVGHIVIVGDKCKMELINYPTPRRKRHATDDGDTAVAAIGVIHNERDHSLIREDQGGRHQVP